MDLSHSVYSKHLHHLIPKWLITFTAMRPDFGFSKGREVSLWSVSQASWLISALRVVLRAFVRVVGAEEIGVAYEEALLVVVGVNEPAGDAVSAVTADLASVRVEHVDAFDFDLYLTVIRIEDVDIRFTEDDKEVAFASVLEVAGHVEVGVHARLEDRDPSQFVEVRGVGFVVESAGDEDVKVGVRCLAGGLHEIGPGDGAEFGGR